MAYLTWLLRIVTFLLLLALASRNLQPVHVQGLFGLEWRAPLALVLLATLALGAVLGVIAALRLALLLRKPLPPEPPTGVDPSRAAPGVATAWPAQTPVGGRRIGRSDDSRV